jgi:hypothetical protein
MPVGPRWASMAQAIAPRGAGADDEEPVVDVCAGMSANTEILRVAQNDGSGDCPSIDYYSSRCDEGGT